jgi:SET domain-containing protein
LTLNGAAFERPSQTSIHIGEDKHVEDILGQFINHSCQPNCEINGREVVALFDIEIDTEINFDYRSSELQHLAVKFDFLCLSCFSQY